MYEERRERNILSFLMPLRPRACRTFSLITYLRYCNYSANVRRISTLNISSFVSGPVRRECCPVLVVRCVTNHWASRS